MLLSLYNGDFEYWNLYSKITIDGATKLIYINSDVTELDVKTDVYSAIKEWILLRDNAKYLIPIRTIGGDSIGGGQYAGDMYFLINGWQIIVNRLVKVTGILYSDDFPSPWIVNAGGGVIASVSSLAIAYSATGGGVAPTVQAIRAELDANSSKLAAIPEIQSSVSAVQGSLTTVQTSINGIPDAVRVELTPELARIMTLQNNPGLTNTQATMLLEMYELLGLDPTKPLVVTTTNRSAGTINQTVATNLSQTTVTRI